MSRAVYPFLKLHILISFLTGRSVIGSESSSPSSLGNTHTASKTGKESASPEAAAAASKQSKEMEDKIKQIQDAYLQAIADMDNLRARTKKEVDNATAFGIQKFSKDIISVLDVLEMALDSVPKAYVTAPAETCAEDSRTSQPSEHEHRRALDALSNLCQGLTMTIAEMNQVLKRHGIETFSPLHQKFDANMHNALFQVPTSEHEPGTVIAVQKKGYLLHGRLLRPAAVGVSKAASS